jgi:hypothetical protein
MKKLLKLMLVIGLLTAILIPGSIVHAASSETFSFPSSGSTVVGSVGFINAEEVGWFWSVTRGDTAYETFNTSMATINGAVLDIEVVTNVLSPGAQVDWNVEINDVLVDSFTVNNGFTGPIHRVLNFAAISGPDYKVEIIVTNEVADGAGSHSLAYSGEYAHSVQLVSSDTPGPGPGPEVGGDIYPTNKFLMLVPVIILGFTLLTSIIVLKRKNIV